MLQSAGAAGAFTLAHNLFASAAQTPASERITVGAIGISGRGNYILNAFLQYPDVQVVAVCDVIANRREAAKKMVDERYGNQDCRTYIDMRELIAQPDIDAVMIATPDHWHALTAITAMKSGKDVFVEKPLCYNIAEGRKMVDTAIQYGRITQLGTHIHNDMDNYRRVVEMVQSGNLGEITRVHCWKTSDTGEGLGNPPNGDPPAELDYNFWQGPAPKKSFNSNRSHFTFRYFWDYSGGIFIDFWCHITDLAYWALNLNAPLSVSAVGARRFRKDNTETPDCLELLYEYPGLSMSWTLHPQPPAFQHMGGIGCIFFGTKATLVANYGSHEIWVNGKKTEDFPRPEPTIPNSPGHIREFLNSIKTREKTTCNIEYAYRLTKGGLLGNIAFRTGDKLVWDDERERVKGNSRANSLLRRNYRSPWKLA